MYKTIFNIVLSSLVLFSSLPNAFGSSAPHPSYYNSLTADRIQNAKWQTITFSDRRPAQEQDTPLRGEIINAYIHTPKRSDQ